MTEPTDKNKKSTRGMAIFREIIAILIWICLVVKIAVYDVDVYLIENYAPSLRWLLDFKLFLILGGISVVWIALGKKDFPIFFIYIVGYPLIVLFWKIPKLLFKNWSIAIVLTPAVFEIVTTFRLFFMSYALASIAAAYIMAAYNKTGLILAMGALSVLLVIHLWSSFKKAYKSTVFSKISQGILAIKEKLKEDLFLQNILDKSKTSTSNESSDSTFDSRLSTFYMIHCGVEFITDKIRDVMRGRKMDLYLILSWIWTIILTSLVFSFEYFALFKINPKAFSAPFTPNYFSFLGFSFGKLTPSSVSTIAPANVYATAICYAELASSIVIVVILVFTILTAARERYKEDIENITKELNEIGDILQQGSQQIFKLAVSEVETVLLLHNQGLVNGVRRLRGMPELPSQVAGNKEQAHIETGGNGSGA
jgi:hypothetical protein